MLRINYINITDAWTSCRITLLFSPNVVVLRHKRIECWVIAVQIMQKDKYSVCFESTYSLCWLRKNLLNLFKYTQHSCHGFL